MKRFYMAREVVIAPVSSLTLEQRRHIDAKPTDYVVTKINSRERSRIVGEDAAELLHNFRSPRSISEAILVFAHSRSVPPMSVLDASFELLDTLVKIGWLVDEVDIPQKQEPVFAAGSNVLDFIICEAIQYLDDTEVYRGVAPDGSSVAIKVLLKDAPAVVARAFNREQEILQLLPATIPVPRLETHGRLDEVSVSVMSWADGHIASSVFHRIRSIQNRDYLSELHRLAVAIVDAYALLHESNVVHGDVHPRNLLISESGQITLVDFGFSEGLNLKTRGATRNTIAFFEEPEYAAARLSKVNRPCATFLGEQYCVAALLYFLIAGNHYVEFSYERDVQSKQVITNVPLPFATQGFVAWPELEAVLQHALSKKPEDRFPSMRAFADALRQVSIPITNTRPRIPKGGKTLLADLPLLSKLLAISPWKHPLQAPTASPTYGAAGIAFALLRLSELLDDANILAVADVWSLRAIQEGLQPEGLTNTQLGINGSLIGNTSLHHGIAGVHFVRSLISRAQGDRVSGQEAIKNFISTVQSNGTNLDLTLGKAGCLIGTAILYRAYGCPQELTDCGDAIASELEATILAQPLRDTNENLTYTGIAHGWAGFLLATMCWYQARSLAMPSTVTARLEELQNAAISTGYSLKWPRKLRSSKVGHTEYLASWCNGSAGQVLLLSHAAQILKSDVYLEKAIYAARDVMEAEDKISDICCGLAGRAFCLASLYRTTGDESWLNRGNSLIQAAIKSNTFGSFPSWSLMKGPLGLELASVELLYCDRARFPFVESEWLD